MHRVLGIVYLTLITVIGALQYEPVWLLVLVTPLWLLWWLHSEEQCIRAEAWDRVREQLRLKSREDE